MADDKLKNLLDDLDNDMSNKEAEKDKLEVVNENLNNITTPTGNDFISQHKKHIIGGIAGLILLVGVYNLGASGNKNDVTKTPVKSNKVTTEVQKQTITNKIVDKVEQKKASQTKTITKRSYSGNITDIHQAGDFLVSYFKNIDDKNFQAAWRQLSPEWRTHFTSIDTYSAMYKDTIEQDVEILDVKFVNNNTAVVFFRLTATDRTSNGFKRQYFGGKWDIIKQDGRLYMDNPDVKKL